VRRRDFIKLLGGAAATWSPAASAEQSAMPVIGYLDSQSPGTYADTTLHGYRRGLKEVGYVEGENVTVEYRWAENQIDRLPELAAACERFSVRVVRWLCWKQLPKTRRQPKRQNPHRVLHKRTGQMPQSQYRRLAMSAFGT
jgi:hypothetical protein